MLKARITQEDYDELNAGLQEHYKKSGDAYVLDTDESSKLETTLKTERRMHQEAVRMLASLVPGLVDESSNTGYVDRKKWRRLVDERADLFEEMGEDFDADEFREWLEGRDEDGGSKPPKDESDLAVQLRESEKERRRLERENKKLERDKKTVEDRTAELETENHTLVQDRDIDRALDAIGVTGKRNRRIARLLWKDQGIEVRDGEVFIRADGAEVDLESYAREWAETEDGKELVAVPDSSGAGDGGESRVKTPPRRGGGGGGAKDEEPLNPTARLRSIWDKDKGQERGRQQSA